jgi:hypothetical protein
VSTINRAPTGLLGFLGIKNFGRNPETIAPVVQPTWNLEELYLVAGATIGPIVTAAFPAGNNLVWDVPQNEVWWVESMSIRSAAALPGGTAGVRLQAITLDQGNNVVQARGPNSIAFLAAEFLCYGISTGFYAMPGTSLGFCVISTVGFAGNLVAEIKRTVMPA